MKVTIIYCNPENNEPVTAIYSRVCSGYSEKHEIVGNFNLSTLDLKFCTGCWSCWWKTPGECAISDGIDEIYKSVMQSELILFIAPLSMGTVPAALKKFIERMIPLIHPYMALVDGEVHHSKRYEKYPETAAVLIEEFDTDEEDREINRGYFNRLVKNFYSRVQYVKFLKSERMEGCFEIPIN